MTTRKKKRSGLKAMLDKHSFNWSMRETFYRHMSMQLRGESATEDALDVFRRRLKRNNRTRADRIVAGAARAMRDGSTLSDALKNWIPSDEYSQIVAGEMSGKLSENFDRIVEVKRRLIEVQNSLKSALVNPLIYLLAVYGMIWSIGMFVTPAIESILPKKATGLGGMFFDLTHMATSFLVVVPVLAFITFLGVIYYSMENWAGPRRVSFERFMPYSYYRDMQGYIWLMNFASILEAGGTDTDILKRQITTASPWLKERLNSVLWRMQDGMSLSEALGAKGRSKSGKTLSAFNFPNPDINDDLASMKSFDAPRVKEIGLYWAEELERSTSKLAKRFGFGMEMMMYVVIGVMFVSINSITTQLGNIAGT